MKKFSILLTITLALTAFLAGYLILGGGVGSSRTTTGTVLDRFDNEQSTEGSGQATETSSPFLITDRQVISLVSSLVGGGITYYEKNTGKVFEFDFESKEEKSISDIALPNFISAIWSPTKKEVIRSFYSLPDRQAGQSGSDFRYYDTTSNETANLDKNIHSVAFSPDGNLIAYYYFDETDPSQSDPITDETGLTTATPVKVGKILVSQTNGQYQKKIIDTRIRGLEISWPAKDQIAFTTPLDELFLLTEDGKLNKLLESTTLLEKAWSKSGRKLLFSGLIDSSSEPMLQIKNIETRGHTILEMAGSASKCAWSIDDISIFCALSKSPSVDEIYRINISDGSKKLVAEPGIRVKEVFLPGSEDYLILISASEEKAYGVILSDQ